MTPKKIVPSSRGEKMLSLLKQANTSPPSSYVPGAVWKRYEHEHKTFFRQIDQKQLNELKNYFSNQHDTLTPIDDDPCTPLPEKCSLPPETNQGSQREVNSTCTSDISDKVPPPLSSEKRFEVGVAQGLENNEERSFPDSAHANSCSMEGLPPEDVNDLQQALNQTASNIFQAADRKIYLSLVSAELPPTRSSETPLELQGKDIALLDETEDVPVLATASKFSSTGNETFLDDKTTLISPNADLEYVVNSDDSVQDPDFDLEKYDDYDSDDCMENGEEKNNKKNRTRKRKTSSQDHELKTDPELQDPGESIVLKSIENTMESEMPTESVLLEPAPKKARKKVTDPSTWKKNLAKRLRNQGKQYIPRKAENPVTAREVKPPCSDKCILRCCEKFTPEERKRLFDMYWGLGDVTRQREFITKHSSPIKPEYRYPKEKARKFNHAFYFFQSGSKKRVCKTFFMATLDINRRTVSTAFQKEENGIVKDDMRGKHSNHIEVPADVKEGIRKHINSIPRIESHYLRKDTSRQYIEGGKSVKGLYRDYKDQREKANEKVGSESMYRFIFDHEFNISFFVPKKDQCEACVVYDLADSEKKASMKTEYDKHLEEKNLARLEKQWDKEYSNDNVIVCCYDLQAAFSTPQGEASVFYYKSKLSSYNLTIYNLKTGETVNNVWHEGDANRGAIEIATCVYKFIEQKATATDRDLKFVFYSDNCSGQQKNKYVFVMYMLCLRKFRNIRSISHKFLITGHTQNEGDGVHSVIEKAVKRARKTGPIFVPSQFVQIIRTAKIRPPFYVVNELSFKDMMDFKTLTNSVGGTFNKNTSNTKFSFNDIKSFIISKENPFTFHYRTSFDGELHAVDIWGPAPIETAFSKREQRKSKRIQTPKNDEKDTIREKRLKILDEWDCKPAYTSPTGISLNKKADLISLINSGVVPHTYRAFYEELVTRINSTKNKESSTVNNED